MVCSNCGVQVCDLSRFCPACGVAARTPQPVARDAGSVSERCQSAPRAEAPPVPRDAAGAAAAADGGPVGGPLFGVVAATAEEEPLGPAREVYAWLFVPVMLLSVSVNAALHVGPWSGVYWLLTFVFGALNMGLFFLDLGANKGQMTPLRFVAALTFLPIWLWMRKGVFGASRAPFWGFLAAWVLGVIVVYPIVRAAAAV